MKRILIALAASSALIGAAQAGDLNHRGSLKDPVERQGRLPEPEVQQDVSRGGIYLNGSLGMAYGDRATSQGTRRENLKLEDLTTDDDVDNETLNLSDYSTLLNKGAADIESPVFGGGVSYLFVMGRFGLEVGVNADAYTDAESTHAYDGKFSTRFDAEGVETGTSTFASSGGVKFDRDFDIDIPIKGHIFLNNRLSVYGGGGVSWARASLEGGSSVEDNPQFDNSFKDSDNAFGYVLLAGTQYWVNSYTVIGLEYNYKHHEFDFDAGATAAGKYGFDGHNVRDNVEVEDDLHIVKGRIGIKLNGVEEALR